MCRKQLQVIFGHKVNKPFKSYIPRGEIICSQKDASAFIGRVVVFLRLSIWLTFSPFLMTLSCVREVPGPYIKDAEMRVRESSPFSGGVSIFLAGTEGMGLVASLCSTGSPALPGATVQLSSKLQPAEGTGRSFHAYMPGKIQLPKIRGSEARLFR